MNAHFIDVGQANATLLEFQCGVVLIDAGADQEHGEALVEFLNRFFDERRVPGVESLSPDIEICRE